MGGIMESIFDIAYLLFAIVGGAILLVKARGCVSVLWMGTMTLLLGIGDSFHLVPRVLTHLTDGDYVVALGVGKLVTSVTMTAFYILLELVREKLFKIEKRYPLIILIGLSVIRIALCCFPQNGWTLEDSSYAWGIWRNIPFAIMGGYSVYLWGKVSGLAHRFKLTWLAILLSFVFYAVTVLGTEFLPILGMAMLPKTICYIWLIALFLLYARKDRGGQRE